MQRLELGCLARSHHRKLPVILLFYKQDVQCRSIALNTVRHARVWMSIELDRDLSFDMSPLRYAWMPTASQHNAVCITWHPSCTDGESPSGIIPRSRLSIHLPSLPFFSIDSPSAIRGTVSLCDAPKYVAWSARVMKSCSPGLSGTRLECNGTVLHPSDHG